MFNQRKHKTFKYKQRFSEKDDAELASEASDNIDFVSKWRESKSTKLRPKGGMKLPILILVLVLLLICMFWLEAKII